MIWSDSHTHLEPVAATPTSLFENALALWAEQTQLSRSDYTRLLEVLSLLENDVIAALPKKLDTLKQHLHDRLPMLPIRKRQVLVNPDVLPTMPTLVAADGPSEDPPETTQYWYDMPVLIQSIIEAHGHAMHFGMAQYVDKPVELWHSRSWGSSIRAASGDYAYDSNGKPVFPGDFIHFPETDVPKLGTWKAKYGRVIFFGKDLRRDSPFYSRPVLTVQPLMSSQDFRSRTKKKIDLVDPWILLEDTVIEILATCVIARVSIQINRLQDIEGEHPKSTKISLVFNFANGTLRCCSKLHSLRGELEVQCYTRPYLSQLSQRGTIALPFMLFIDDFGVHRNMYKALKGFYLSPATLSYSNRRRLANHYTISLGPHGVSVDDMVDSFCSEFQSLDRGMTMEVHGQARTVCAFVLGLTGDMPQQAANGGFLSHQGTFGCRSCYCPDYDRGNMDFNVIEEGRYHLQTLHYRDVGENIQLQRERKKHWQSLGLRPQPSAIERISPALDLILGRSYDIPHSEWKGLGRLLQDMLISVLCPSGLASYVHEFMWFPTPSTWPRIQNPARYLKSWSLSEAGYAVLLTPLVLRRYAKNDWFRQDFLQRAAAVMEKHEHIPGDLGTLDKIVYAYSAVAKAVALISVPVAVPSKTIDKAVILGRRCFQSLMKSASKSPPRDPEAETLDEQRRVTKEEDQYLANCGLPNVHIGLHLSEFSTEYGVLMNCHVLAGEAKHK